MPTLTRQRVSSAPKTSLQKTNLLDSSLSSTGIKMATSRASKTAKTPAPKGVKGEDGTSETTIHITRTMPRKAGQRKEIGTVSGKKKQKAILITYADHHVKPTVPPTVILSDSARSRIAREPLAVQRELVSVITRGNVQKVAVGRNLYVAKSKSGYRVMYKHEGDNTTVVDVFSPEQIKRFAQ